MRVLCSQTTDAVMVYHPAPDQEPVGYAPGKVDSAHCRHNQITKDQQHAGDPDKARYHQTKKR